MITTDELNEEREVFELAKEAYGKSSGNNNQVDTDVRIKYLKAKCQWESVSGKYMRNL